MKQVADLPSRAEKLSGMETAAIAANGPMKKLANVIRISALRTMVSFSLPLAPERRSECLSVPDTPDMASRTVSSL